VVLANDRFLDSRFHGEAELVANRQIEASVHDAETVGRADQRIGRLLEVIARENFDAEQFIARRIGLVASHLVAVAKRLSPVFDERSRLIDQDDLGRKPSRFDGPAVTRSRTRHVVPFGE
jgi:hypothetical protein